MGDSVAAYFQPRLTACDEAVRLARSTLIRPVRKRQRGIRVVVASSSSANVTKLANTGHPGRQHLTPVRDARTGLRRVLFCAAFRAGAGSPVCLIDLPL